ncbi:hypothetical protein [Pararhizobium antarcticum]|uniref:Uncharacterized protein n=1 Tax=Pararhizobium antarcticum TaxID=1798805 RepID=A0A657LQL5_9HYPH|nr:hypothetical protein [Pararhizobium antarcticum]OJF94436.1 hypothetical protein AX760_20155 [Pararhizobium antarcticum]OJF97698.1 hypothetical protein AX761_13965 [Rhizobium sp. 58]
MATYTDERGDTVRTEETNRKVEATAVEARQGRLGRPVLYVLVGGLFLAMIAWGAAEFFGEAVDNDAATEVTQPTTGTSTPATPDNQPVVDNTQPAGESQQTAPVDRDPTPETGTGGQGAAPSATP